MPSELEIAQPPIDHSKMIKDVGKRNAPIARKRVYSSFTMREHACMVLMSWSVTASLVILIYPPSAGVLLPPVIACFAALSAYFIFDILCSITRSLIAFYNEKPASFVAYFIAAAIVAAVFFGICGSIAPMAIPAGIMMLAAIGVISIPYPDTFIGFTGFIVGCSLVAAAFSAFGFIPALMGLGIGMLALVCGKIAYDVVYHKLHSTHEKDHPEDIRPPSSSLKEHGLFRDKTSIVKRQDSPDCETRALCLEKN
jgi:hypothetical protein